MLRIAWFSPMPPIRSGPAADSALLVEALGSEFEIDVFIERVLPGMPAGCRTAHEFVWRNRLQPYDLTVFQLGNSSHHAFEWPYLFRYPGLVVMHDAHLHHARAATLLHAKRAADYRAELAACHPELKPDLAEIAIAGFDTHLYYSWPMTRLIVESARMAAVHSTAVAEALLERSPAARVRTVRLGHGVALADDELRDARDHFRAQHAIPADAVVFGCYGGLAPDKRIPQILDAFAAVKPYVPAARLLFAGADAPHFRLADAVRARGLEASTTLTGYLDTEAALTGAIAACDVALNLRWPTAREISGPWLRCLAAGKATVIIDLAHLADVPSLDPRTWRPHGGTGAAAPVTIALDILDEDHSLRLAMRRLAADPALRASLGRAGRAWWDARHSPARMIEDYRRIIPEAAASPIPGAALPAHLTADGSTRMKALLAPFGLESPLR